VNKKMNDQGHGVEDEYVVLCRGYSTLFHFILFHYVYFMYAANVVRNSWVHLPGKQTTAKLELQKTVAR
jgi:hypothetical protein